MNEDIAARELAQEGLLKIEDAIVRLLSRNPQGLGNSEIAGALNLTSDFRGNQRNYITYSVLGGLIAQDRVNDKKIGRNRIFTKVQPDSS